MREIKFRGKRKDNGEWVEGCYLETQGIGRRPGTNEVALGNRTTRKKLLCFACLSAPQDYSHCPVRILQNLSRRYSAI